MRYLILLLILWGCNEQSKPKKNSTAPIVAKTKAIRHGSPEVELVVLGTVQDAGAPQIACQKECCKNRFDAPDPGLRVVSLGLIDHNNQERYVFEATPNFPKQLRHLQLTVGFIIEGPNKKALFIPDIDKWERWDTPIETLIKKVDYAFLDATFYDSAEIGHRNIAEIPHPFIIESMQRFQALTASEKSKIHFIHFNHTNLLLEPGSEPYKTVIKNGYAIAEFDAHFSL